MGTLVLVDVGHTEAHRGIKRYGSKSLDFVKRSRVSKDTVQKIPCTLPKITEVVARS